MDKITAEDIEARGFIFGDGCFMVTRLARRKCHYVSRKTGVRKTYEYIEYSPRVNVTQRIDGRAILEWLMGRYGGSIAENKASLKHGSNPVLQWTVQGNERCRRLAEICLASPLPHLKKKTIKPFLEFVRFRIAHHGKYTEKELEKIEGWRQEVLKANSYQGR